jgi:hypothetical protein
MIRDDLIRASALTEVGGRLAGERKREVLSDAAVKAIPDEYYWATVPSQLAAHLTGEQLADALAAAKAIRDDSSRATVLTSIAGHLTGKQKREVLSDALATAKAIGNEVDRASGLRGLGKNLSDH